MESEERVQTSAHLNSSQVVQMAAYESGIQDSKLQSLVSNLPKMSPSSPIAGQSPLEMPITRRKDVWLLASLPS